MGSEKDAVGYIYENIGFDPLAPIYQKWDPLRLTQRRDDVRLTVAATGSPRISQVGSYAGAKRIYAGQGRGHDPVDPIDAKLLRALHFYIYENVT